jgi:hypothetical protein
MRRFFNRKTALLLTLLAGFVFIVPQSAHADWFGIGEITVQAITTGLTALFEVAILPLAAALMALAGLVMDAAIGFSLHTSYIFNFSPAVNLGWVIVRDIANIFFIFILIYISLGTIIKGTSFGTKQLLTQLIIAALLVNFSMFFTKVIIDVSNVFGNWLYGGVQKTLEANSVDPNKSVSISALIAHRLGVLEFWAQGQTKDATHVIKDGTWSITNSVVRLIIVLIATYIFAYVAVLFIARAITLLILLVFSPIGFVGKLLPQTSKYSKQWWSELGNAAIFPIAFLLMLYISLQFINGFGLLQKQLSLTNSTVQIAGFDIMKYFQYFIVIFLLKACLKVAKENAGEIGGLLGGLASGLAKLAVNAGVTIGSGGVALAMRTATAAAFAARGADAGKGGSEAWKAARATLRSSNPLPFIGRNAKPVKETLKGWAKDGSWDVRNLPLGGKTNIGSILSDASGVDVKAKSAKDFNDDKEKFEKEYKLETNIKDILGEIRDLEKINRDLAAAPGDPVAMRAKELAEKNIRDKTSKMSNKDLEAATLRIHSEAVAMAKRDPNQTNQIMEGFTDQLKQNQVSAILNGEAPGAVKNSIRSARQADFKKAIDPAGPIDPAKVQAALYKLGNEEVSKLDIEDLKNPQVVAHLRAGHLQKIADEYTFGQRQEIRDLILTWRANAHNTVGGPHPAEGWFSTAAGQQF